MSFYVTKFLANQEKLPVRETGRRIGFVCRQQSNKEKNYINILLPFVSFYTDITTICVDFCCRIFISVKFTVNKDLIYVFLYLWILFQYSICFDTLTPSWKLIRLTSKIEVFLCLGLFTIYLTLKVPNEKGSR